MAAIINVNVAGAGSCGSYDLYCSTFQQVCVTFCTRAYQKRISIDKIFFADEGSILIYNFRVGFKNAFYKWNGVINNYFHYLIINCLT